MDYMEIENIHKKYNLYIDGYNLIGSYSVFIPFFKIRMKMFYTYEIELNIIEEYICTCVSRGIKEDEQIKFVLALEDDIFDLVIDGLIDNKYLIKYLNEYGCLNYDLTELGHDLFEKKRKYEPRSIGVYMYYDGLNPEYKIEFFENDMVHNFLRYKDIKDKASNLVILPETLPKYDREKDLQILSKNVLTNIMTINDKYDYEIDKKNIIDIVDFEITDKRELFYHEYRVLVYKNRNEEYKLLAHDSCGLNFFDQRVTDTILDLYNDGKFNYLIDETIGSKQTTKDIIEALENYALKEYHEFNSEKTEEIIKNIHELKNREIPSKYIMNYDIRKLFLKYLKEAEHSLYIISPWMNNYIVNDEFINNIINLLKRGVSIRIICGITDGNEENMNIRDKKTMNIAEKLSKVAEPYGNLFKIYSGQTHEKLLICDEKYYINGSFNFLSYAGEDNEFFRNEGSTYSEDEQLIRETINLRFNF